MKQIIYTILTGESGITLKCNSFMVDPEDREIPIVAVVLLSYIKRLTIKYNKRNIAVLFEVD